MAKLKDIKGTNIQFLEADPVDYVGSWSSGGNLNTAKRQGTAFGTLTAGVYAGGNKPPPTTTNVEEYNGTAWSEVNDMPTGSFALASASNAPQTSGLIFGGTNAANTAESSEADSYDGTNWTTGSGTLTETIPVKPSLTFSPLKLGSFSFILFRFLATLFIVLVKTVFNPSKCVPPSIVLILLAKPNKLSLYASTHQSNAAST